MIFVYLISLIHSYFFHYFISVGQDQKQLDNLETHSQSKNMEKGKADVDNDVNVVNTFSQIPRKTLIVIETHIKVIKQKYPGAVSSKSVKDKELERKKEQKRKPGEGLMQVLTILLILKTLLVYSC